MTDLQVRIGHCNPDAPNVDIHADSNRIIEEVASDDLSS